MASSFSSGLRGGRGRKLKSEINVVPYIDVMLVLLIIFMVTAPLLNLGVDIQLPQSNAKSIQNDKGPIIISVDKDGALFLTIPDAPKEATDADSLLKKISAFIRNNPQTPVLIGGDERTDYGKVYQVMALAQQAGAAKIGLMSKPVETSR
jgi:biopolymer transport protein TolR